MDHVYLTLLFLNRCPTILPFTVIKNRFETFAYSPDCDIGRIENYVYMQIVQPAV